jgi:hypothetical protein
MAPAFGRTHLSPHQLIQQHRHTTMMTACPPNRTCRCRVPRARWRR